MGWCGRWRTPAPSAGRGEGVAGEGERVQPHDRRRPREVDAQRHLRMMTMRSLMQMKAFERFR